MPIMQIVQDEKGIWHTTDCEHYDRSKAQDIMTIGGPDFPPQPEDKDACKKCLLSFKYRYKDVPTIPGTPVLTGEAAKEFIRKAENPKPMLLSDQQVDMYLQMINKNKGESNDHS